MTSSVTQNTGIAALVNASHNKPPPSETTTSLFGEDGFTFGDIIDIVNPLQHIPIVNNIYRKISGDVIAPAMEIAGGALFGGPIGAFTSMITSAFKSEDKIDSTDPNSPYGDQQADPNNPTALAINATQQYPNAINDNDYSVPASAGESVKEGKQVINTHPALNSLSGWTLNSEFINREPSLENTANNSISANAIKSKHNYQPADGIINLAYKNTDAYTNVITSTKPPVNAIDITIGSALDPS